MIIYYITYQKCNYLIRIHLYYTEFKKFRLLCQWISLFLDRLNSYGWALNNFPFIFKFRSVASVAAGYCLPCSWSPAAVLLPVSEYNRRNPV